MDNIFRFELVSLEKLDAEADTPPPSSRAADDEADEEEE